MPWSNGRKASKKYLNRDEKETRERMRKEKEERRKYEEELAKHEEER